MPRPEADPRVGPTKIDRVRLPTDENTRIGGKKPQSYKAGLCLYLDFVLKTYLLCCYAEYSKSFVRRRWSRAALTRGYTNEKLSSTCSAFVVDWTRQMNIHAFLSYNHADSTVAEGLYAQLVLVGGQVWLDKWEIRAGDSIPGRLNEGLAAFNVLVLIWWCGLRVRTGCGPNWTRRSAVRSKSHPLE